MGSSAVPWRRGDIRSASVQVICQYGTLAELFSTLSINLLRVVFKVHANAAVVWRMAAVGRIATRHVSVSNASNEVRNSAECSRCGGFRQSLGTRAASSHDRRSVDVDAFIVELGSTFLARFAE
jgi:hypothetical protein